MHLYEITTMELGKICRNLYLCVVEDLLLEFSMGFIKCFFLFSHK